MKKTDWLHFLSLTLPVKMNVVIHDHLARDIVEHGGVQTLRDLLEMTLLEYVKGPEESTSRSVFLRIVNRFGYRIYRNRVCDEFINRQDYHEPMELKRVCSLRSLVDYWRSECANSFHDEPHRWAMRMSLDDLFYNYFRDEAWQQRVRTSCEELPVIPTTID